MHVGTSGQFCVNPKPDVKPGNSLLTVSFTVSGPSADQHSWKDWPRVAAKTKIARSGYAQSTAQLDTNILGTGYWCNSKIVEFQTPPK
jgi:hypothetical protein